jgi:sec-independent protein translocase protein TatA
MDEYTRYILALWTPQGLDWLWIFLIVLVIFGGKKLPELARSIGRGLTQFKKGIREAEDEVEQTKQEINKEVDSAGRNIAGKDKDTTGPNDSHKPD